MSATSRAVRVTEGRWATLSSHRSRTSGWASLEVSLPPWGGGPGSFWSVLTEPMESVESMRVEAASVPSARRNDGSVVLTSAPAVVVRPPNRTALVTLPRSLGLLHRGNELKYAQGQDFVATPGGIERFAGALPPHRGRTEQGGSGR